MADFHYPCGCILLDFGCSHGMRWCSKHAAAPAMYEALKDARSALSLIGKEHGEGILGWEKVIQPPNSYRYPLLHELLHNMDNALALADGDSDA